MGNQTQLQNLFPTLNLSFNRSQYKRGFRLLMWLATSALVIQHSMSSLGGRETLPCLESMDFTRHLDRLDAILITRLSDENTQGISAVLERKSVSPVYPQIGHFFANILETGKDKEKEKHDEEERDKLLVNVIHEGDTMIENLRILNLKPQICFRDNICDP